MNNQNDHIPRESEAYKGNLTLGDFSSLITGFLDVNSQEKHTLFELVETKGAASDYRGTLILAQFRCARGIILNAIYDHYMTMYKRHERHPNHQYSKQDLAQQENYSDSTKLVWGEPVNKGTAKDGQNRMLAFLKGIMKEEVKNYETIFQKFFENKIHTGVNGKRAFYMALLYLVKVPVNEDIYGEEVADSPKMIAELFCKRKKNKLMIDISDEVLFQIGDTIIAQLLGELSPENPNVEELLYLITDQYRGPVYMTDAQIIQLNKKISNQEIVKNPYIDVAYRNKFNSITFFDRTNDNEGDVKNYKKEIILAIARRYMPLIFKSVFARPPIEWSYINRENEDLDELDLEDFFNEQAQLQYDKAYHKDSGEKGQKEMLAFLKEVGKKDDVEGITTLILTRMNDWPGSERTAILFDLYRRGIKKEFLKVDTARGPSLACELVAFKNAILFYLHYHYMQFSTHKPQKTSRFFSNDTFSPSVPQLVVNSGMNQDSQVEFFYRQIPNSKTSTDTGGMVMMNLYVMEMVKIQINSLQELAGLTYYCLKEDKKILEGENRSKAIYRVFCQNILLKLEEKGNDKSMTIYDYVVAKAEKNRIDTSEPSAIQAIIDKDCKAFALTAMKQLSGQLKNYEPNIQELAKEKYKDDRIVYGYDADVALTNNRTHQSEILGGAYNFNRHF